MNLMISETAMRLAPAAMPPNTAVDVISYAMGESALGKVLVARSTASVCAVFLGDDCDELEADLTFRFPKATPVANEAANQRRSREGGALRAQPGRGIVAPARYARDAVPVPGLGEKKLRAISIGRTVSYTERARWISPFASPRAVANACAANPIALAMRSNGDLAGYRWGIERKREMIRREALT